MSNFSFPEYADRLSKFVNRLVGSGMVIRVQLDIDQRSNLRGMIAGILFFPDQAELHFREFIDTTLDEPKLMFVYHFQDQHKGLVFRYDNAAHRPGTTQRPHKHEGANIVVADVPSLDEVVYEILKR